MKKKTIKSECDCNSECGRNTKMSGACGAGCGFYGLGFLGALIYFWSTATSFWIGVLGILKALVWPVFVVYELLKFLAA